MRRSLHGQGKAGAYLMLTGKLVYDPELRFTASGIACMTFQLRVSPGIDPKEPVFTCLIWAEFATVVAKDERFFGNRDAEYSVDGVFRPRTYRIRDGETRRVVEYVVRKIWAPGDRKGITSPEMTRHQGT